MSNSWKLSLVNHILQTSLDILSAKQIEGLNSALDLLPDDNYEVLMCSYQDFMSSREIADEMDMTVDEVNRLLTESIWRLRQPDAIKLIG